MATTSRIESSPLWKIMQKERRLLNNTVGQGVLPNFIGLRELVREQSDARCLWREHNQGSQLVAVLADEISELQEAYQGLDGPITEQNNFDLMSEVGDVLYLIFKFIDHCDLDLVIEASPNTCDLGDICRSLVAQAEKLEEIFKADQHLNLGQLVKATEEIIRGALKFCELLEIDPKEALMMKILRNEFKYPASLLLTGDYATQVAQARRDWEVMGGDFRFLHIYAARLQPIVMNGHGTRKAFRMAVELWDDIIVDVGAVAPHAMLAEVTQIH